MQKLLIAGLAAVTAGAAVLAVAATPDENRPVMGAYLNVGFGGQQALPRNFHYGLRLDHDRRFVPAEISPLMQVDFDRVGLTSAKLNGLDMVSRSIVMRQDETTGEPGMFSTYTVTDWVLVGLGVVALGGGVAAIADGEDSPEPASSDDGGGATGGGQADAAAAAASAATAAATSAAASVASAAAGVIPTFDGHASFSSLSESQRAEYLEWLNGGNGHMGDLGPTR